MAYSVVVLEMVDLNVIIDRKGAMSTYHILISALPTNPNLIWRAIIITSFIDTVSNTVLFHSMRYCLRSFPLRIVTNFYSTNSVFMCEMSLVHPELSLSPLWKCFTGENHVVLRHLFVHLESLRICSTANCLYPLCIYSTV